MKKGILQAFLASASFVILSTPAFGADVNWDYWTGFSPSAVVISPGESVTWFNVDRYGMNVTITVAGILSQTVVPYGSWQVNFPSGGIYDVESDHGDYGTVTVGSIPSVTINNPANSAVFSAPASFTIGAEATDSDGMYDVRFYLDDSIPGSQLIGDDFTPPYSASVTNLPGGSYTLTAIATDIYGIQNSNSIAITVNGAPALILGSPRFAGGQFLFDVTGLTVGKTNVVQHCTNLSTGTWTSIATNVATGTSRTVTNAAAAGPRFYRIFENP